MLRRDEVISLVNKDGLNLKDHSGFQNDKEIVKASVQQNGYALEYASEGLRNNYEIVLAAVEQNGWALGYASEDLKRDKDIVLAAVEQTPFIHEKLPDHLKNDEDIINAMNSLYWLEHDPKIFLNSIEKIGDKNYASDKKKLFTDKITESEKDNIKPYQEFYDKNGKKENRKEAKEVKGYFTNLIQEKEKKENITR